MGIRRWLKFEFRLRNPWALLIQSLGLLLLAAMLFSLLRYRQPLDGFRFALAFSLSLATLLWIVQMRFTAKVGAWYGNSFPLILLAISPAWFYSLSPLTGPWAFMEWCKIIGFGIMLAFGLRGMWFDFVEWPREARTRGLALDAASQES